MPDKIDFTASLSPLHNDQRQIGGTDGCPDTELSNAKAPESGDYVTVGDVLVRRGRGRRVIDELGKPRFVEDSEPGIPTDDVRSADAHSIT